MKKLALTIAIVLGMSVSSFAEYGGGLFQRGAVSDNVYYNRTTNNPLLPGHGLFDNQDANETPLGGGIALLVGLGAAYMVGKKRREE